MKRDKSPFFARKSCVKPRGASFLFPAVFGSAALLMITLLCGCEVDSAAQKVKINPDSATLRYGESVTLTAYNGYVYTWSLANETYGMLSARSGMTVTYTSYYDPPTPVVQVVRVTSSFSDNGGGSSSTNSSSSTNTAEAYITHIPATSDLVSAASTP